jgi:hypothetical protein
MTGASEVWDKMYALVGWQWQGSRLLVGPPFAGCEGVGGDSPGPGTLLATAGRGSYPWPDHP